MTIKEFAGKHRLRVSLDECNEAVIMGRIGSSNIYEHGDGVLGVMFITDGKKPPRTLLWNRFRADCLAAGMTVRQNGDAEGSFTFDPDDHKQAKVAIRGIRARIKKVLSDSHRAALRATRFRPRSNDPQLSVETAQTPEKVPDDPKHRA